MRTRNMRNLWVEHWIDLGIKNKGHGATTGVHIRVMANVDGMSKAVADLRVDYAKGEPRVELVSRGVKGLTYARD